MANVPIQDREAGLPTSVAETGRRVTAYSPELALRIVEAIAEGKRLNEICKRGTGMPHPTTFMKWVARTPELAKAYAAARELSAMVFEEQALETAEKLLDDPGTAQRVSAANTLINQLRWSASKRDPKQYGDRSNNQITVPIHISTSLDMGDGGKGAMAELPDIYTIDLKPEPEPKALAPVKEKPDYTGRWDHKVKLTPRVPPEEQKNPFIGALRADERQEKPDADPV